jgi:hypothetical protein
MRYFPFKIGPAARPLIANSAGPAHTSRMTVASPGPFALRVNFKSELKVAQTIGGVFKPSKACYNIQLMFVNHPAIEFFLDRAISGIAPL